MRKLTTAITALARDQQHQDWLHEAIAQHFAGETK